MCTRRRIRLRSVSSRQNARWHSAAMVQSLQCTDLIRNDLTLMRDPVLNIRIGDRQILVLNRIAETDSVFISAPPPVTLKTDFDTDSIAAILQIPPAGIADPAGISFINAGLNTLLVPLRSLSTLLSVHPDQQRLREFCTRHDIEIILIHTPETTTPPAAYRTRVFAPVFGTWEPGNRVGKCGIRVLSARCQKMGREAAHHRTGPGPRSPEYHPADQRCIGKTAQCLLWW